MKAQYVVSVADDGGVSVDRVKATALPLSTSGLTDFFVVGQYDNVAACISLASDIYKKFTS